MLPEAEGGRQLLTMPGPGKLILVDDRPENPPGAEADGPAAAAPTPAVRLAGRGATFFRWVDALRLDGRSRDAELSGDVFMNHDPRDGSPRVKLYGDRLRAAFAAADETAEPSAAAEAELRSVHIDGSVVIDQEQRTVTADHLRYLTHTDRVQLWSDDGRGVAITADGRTFQAETAAWNLLTDRITVDGGGGGSEAIR